MADLKTTVEAVKARAKQARPRSTVDLPIPIYDGQFLARFGVLDGDRIERFGEAAEGGQADDMACEFIADACRQMLVRGDPPEPLTDDGQPVRFDEAFAAAVGLELAEQTSAAVVRACWTLDDGTLNSVALNMFGSRLLTWMQDTTTPIEGEVMGESLGGATSNGLVAPPSAA